MYNFIYLSNIQVSIEDNLHDFNFISRYGKRIARLVDINYDSFTQIYVRDANECNDKLRRATQVGQLVS